VPSDDTQTKNDSRENTIEKELLMKELKNQFKNLKIN
jgi:hypothetical protein